MSNTIFTKPVELIWTNYLFEADTVYKHSSGAPMYSVTMCFDKDGLEDFKEKIKIKLGETAVSKLYVKEEDNQYKCKAKCVAWFDSPRGKTNQKPYVKWQIDGSEVKVGIENEKAIVEIHPKFYARYGKLGLILKGASILGEKMRPSEEIEKELFGFSINEDTNKSFNSGV